MHEIETYLLGNAYEMQQLRYDLHAMTQAHQCVGSPATYWPSIHVGGTNGKGSVTTKIARGLQEQGMKVGLYTSPHLFTVNERIQINGRPVHDVHEWIRMVLPLQLTFFETLTLAAFLAFRDAAVDIAVIEVGLGGRLDATNIIHPQLAVVTSIGRDHMQILGPSLEAIAQEKAGIVKAGIPVILGPTVIPYADVFGKHGNRVEQVMGPFLNFEEENQAVARRALECLGMTPSHTALSALPRCRFERHGNLILDVAHNVPGIEAVMDRCFQQHHPFRVVAGFSADKEITPMIEVISRYEASLHLTQASHPRAFRFNQTTVAQTLDEAWQLAQSQGELLLVCGSFFLMQEAYQWALDQGVIRACLKSF